MCASGSIGSNWICVKSAPACEWSTMCATDFCTAMPSRPHHRCCNQNAVPALIWGCTYFHTFCRLQLERGCVLLVQTISQHARNGLMWQFTGWFVDRSSLNVNACLLFNLTKSQQTQYDRATNNNSSYNCSCKHIWEARNATPKNGKKKCITHRM